MILSKENILKYISQEEILQRYTGYSIDYRKKYCNPFRKDKHADCMFRKGYKYIFFTDYARPEYSGDCFKITSLYYGLSLPGDFYEVCRHINNDFKLGLNDGKEITYKPIERKEITCHEVVEKEITYSDIKVRVRPFSKYDLAYWSKINVDEEILNDDDFKTFRADAVWINGDLFYHYQETDLCFAYWFKHTNTFKIYKPYGYNDKWRTNSLEIDGYYNLPEKGDLLFITKSRKDRMVLKRLGFLSIAVQAEGNYIPDNILIDIKKRFKKIIIFFDNDEPGIKNANRLSLLYNLDSFNIPEEFNEKDPSEFVEAYDEVTLLHLIKQKIDG